MSPFCYRLKDKSLFRLSLFSFLFVLKRAFFFSLISYLSSLVGDMLGDMLFQIAYPHLLVLFDGKGFPSAKDCDSL